ncbi:unnamed protein product, partial [Vitis vinifera]
MREKVYSKLRYEIRFHPNTFHLFKQIKGFLCVGMLSTSNQHCIPHAKIPDWYFMENQIRIFNHSTF